MFFDLILETEDKRLDIVADIIAQGLDLWFLGCGEFARRAKMVMDSYGIPVKGCCVDDEYYSPDMEFFGLPVERLSSVLAFPEGKAILVTFFSHELGERAKETLGKTMPTYYCDDWYNWFKMDYSFVLKHSLEYEWLYSRLGDQLSKDVFVAYFQSHLSGNGAALDRLRGNKNHQYDYALLGISAQDSMLDCGSYNGDTIDDVFSYVSGALSHVIAIEPDKVNQRLFLERYSELIDAKAIRLVPYGCGDRNQIARFYCGKGGDSLFADPVTETHLGCNDAADCEEVQMVRIDDVVGDRYISWIKMDIEGGELSALKGAAETIVRNKPKLSICVYHRIGDLLDIPSFLESLSVRGVHYRYYLRHHGKSMSDTVLYAIPE